jgi:autotransporter-associated beta strand protein
MKLITNTAWAFLMGAICFTSIEAHAQRQMEHLGRGVVALRKSTTQVYIGWRMLGTDPDDLAFNLYRSANGGAPVQLNPQPLTNTTDFVDTGANLDVSNAWWVRPVLNEREQTASLPCSLPAHAPENPYLSLPLQAPPNGTTLDGSPYDYHVNDGSAGDLDGDGEFEIVLKWDPSNAKDNSQSGYTGNVFLDAYKLDGTRLWRIDLGRNIRAGAHYTQFMVFDLDGDGKSEVACKTADGTIDGMGTVIGNASADYRSTSGYVLSGPEFLTVFDGATGRALVTTNYLPARGAVSDWGDSYGNRVDRFLACVAYLDGVRPSLVMCRGYYTRTVLVAWNWRNSQLIQAWTFDSNSSGNGRYAGQGNHNLSVGDVDADGKDEIVYGACAIDHDGKGLYTTGLGHGDAMHLSDMDPARPGLEVWQCHESASSIAGGEFRDAQTGQLIWGLPSTGDVGRACAGNIMAGFKGYQMWASGASSGLYNCHGERIGNTPSSCNFLAWWDADLLRELLNNNAVSKYGGSTLLTANNCTSINGTKSTPCLSADLLGDWREEVVFPTTDSTELRIYTTTIPATNRFYTLMHDPQYRLSVAWQNVAYNQPPHPGFYLGEGMLKPPLPPMVEADLLWHGNVEGTTWDTGTTSNWLSNEVAQVFNAGDTVLFDLTGSNLLPVNLAGTLIPGAVTVHSPTDYVFGGNGSLAGTMTLVKAGPGTLTINTTNTFTGLTTVSAGTLLVNGSLEDSPVIIIGPGRMGGTGRLGQGLTVLTGGGVTPGDRPDAAGTLNVDGNLTQWGDSVSYFDLSDDPTGTVKTNDLISVTGNLTLQDTHIIQINPLDGRLTPGTYPLFQYGGTLTGGLTNLTVSGVPSLPVTLINPPGSIALVVLSTRPPTNLTWIGAIGGKWDMVSSSNWLNGVTQDWFVPQDRVRFDNLGGTSPMVNLIGIMSPASVVVDATMDYTLTGKGSIMGTGGLLKTNTGTLTIQIATNSYMGPTVMGGGTLVVTRLADAGMPSSIGAAGSSPTNLVCFGTTLRFQGSLSETDRGATLNAAGAAIDVVTNTSLLILSGPLVGTGGLTKTGAGTLVINASNTYSGGTFIKTGTLRLGSDIANPYGLGSGNVTLDGGTLTMFNNTATSSDVTASWDLVVPPNSTGTLNADGRCKLNGSLTGSGTLNFYVNYVRTELRGNWSAFAGRINVTADSDGGDFRVNNSYGYAKAAIHLAANVNAYHLNGNTVAVGELSGSSGANLSGAAWIVGARNTDATFAGTISGNSISKVGSGTWTLTRNLTYTGTTSIEAGTLAISGAGSISNTASISITAGAVLDVSGRTGGSLTLASGQTLTGDGSVKGDLTVGSGVRLAPGISMGRLTFNNSLTLAADSTTIIELSKSPTTNDVVRVLSTLTYGGTLVVTLMNRSELAAGDTFKVFEATNYRNSFSHLALPPLASGLAWNTNDLNRTGALRVVNTAQPIFGVMTAAQGSVVVHGSGGTPNSMYYILCSTNVPLPLAQWTPLLTNTFDTSGHFAFTNAIDLNTPQQFFLIQMP